MGSASNKDSTDTASKRIPPAENLRPPASHLGAKPASAWAEVRKTPAFSQIMIAKDFAYANITE